LRVYYTKLPYYTMLIRASVRRLSLFWKLFITTSARKEKSSFSALVVKMYLATCLSYCQSTYRTCWIIPIMQYSKASRHR